MARRSRAQPQPDSKKIPDFTPTDVKELKEAFDIFDREGNGIIQIGDMLDYLESLSVNSKYSTVFNLVARLEKEFPDGINFKEFLEHAQFLLGGIEDEDGLSRLFETLDIDSKEYLDKERLRELAREIGENISEEELDELIEESYECPNGKVDIDSFYRMMIKSTFDKE